MKQVVSFSTLIGSFLAAVACAGSGGTPPAAEADEPSAAPTAAPATPATTGDETMSSLQNACPMAVPDVAVAVSETEDGVALDFTTSGDNVADLRRRVQSMAQHYGQCDGRRGMMWHRMRGGGMGPGQGRGPGPMHHQGMGPGEGRGSGPMHHQGMGPGRGPGPMPAVTTAVEEREGGARIVLTPKDSGQLQALRQHVQMQQQRMQAGECWMFQAEASSSEASQP